MPVARKAWQPILVLMVAALARRRTIHHAADRPISEGVPILLRTRGLKVDLRWRGRTERRSGPAPRRSSPLYHRVTRVGCRWGATVAVPLDRLGASPRRECGCHRRFTAPPASLCLYVPVSGSVTATRPGAPSNRRPYRDPCRGPSVLRSSVTMIAAEPMRTQRY